MVKRIIRKKAGLPRLKQLLFAVLLLASCDGTVYHQFREVDGDGWNVTDTLQFLYEGSGRSNKAVEMAVQVRYGSAYKYKNLYLRVETLHADSVLLSVDTLCCRIYDDAGRRLGSTAGSIYQNESQKVLLNASCADTLLLKLSHIMPDESLQGVFDMGVELTGVNR